MKNHSTERQKLDRDSLKRIGPRVLGFAKPHTRTLLIGLLALALGSGINLLFPHLFRKILNNELGLTLTAHLPLITALAIGLFALQGVVFYLRHYCFSLVGYRVVADLRSSLFAGLLRQDASFFDESRTGDLLSRLSSDCEVVQRSVTTNVSAGLRYFVQVLGGIALMLTISVKLTLMIILLIPLLVLMSIFWAKRLRVLSKAIQTEIGSAAIIAEEAISGARTVKMFSAEQSEIARYNEVIQRTVGLGRERTKIAATFSSSMVFLIHSSIAVMFFYGTTLVLESALTVGDLSAFLMYCVIVAASFGFLAGVWDEFLQAVGAGERIFEIIDRQPQITAPAEPKLPASWDAQVPGPVVEFRNVYFEYPSRVGSPVLQGVSFSINAGETVALVGPSGSGKSTIASLILRLYDVSFSDVSFSDVNFSEVNSGEVYFAGENVKAYRPEDLRRDISVVSQEPQVFSVSILENIRFGKPTATEAEILQAARLANVHTFAERLPEGYQTLVGNRGTQLSGGERQRLTIARALLKDPRFLILDEATSSLDSENEHLIQQALTHLVHGRTTLVIAHRLSTIHHANQVLVVRHGRIEQRGTHESLFAQPGLYKSLVEHQLL